jgi:hypothetical protein
MGRLVVADSLAAAGFGLDGRPDAMPLSEPPRQGNEMGGRAARRHPSVSPRVGVLTTTRRSSLWVWGNRRLVELVPGQEGFRRHRAGACARATLGATSAECGSFGTHPRARSSLARGPWRVLR